MSTEEIPATVLQTSIEDEKVSQAHTEKSSSLQMVSDVNENKLNEDAKACQTQEENTLPSKDAQDSINNNENCNVMCGQLSCKTGCGDSDHAVMDSIASASLSTKENATAKGKRVTGRRNTRNKKGNNGRCTEIANVDVTLSEDIRLVASIPELAKEESYEQRDQKQLRDSLFSLIREGVERMEVTRVLPTCLHQIAETYFLEEDYEKAMQFIQLEKIYHEQLLANLSAIQAQWETKWKTDKLVSLPSSENSDKALSSKEFERLSNICSSHQHPQSFQSSNWRLSPSEKHVQIQTLAHLVEKADIDGPFSHCPDRTSELGICTTADRKSGVAVMTENLPPNVSTADLRTEGTDDQVLPSESCKEEQQQSICGATLEIHTRPTGTETSADPDSRYSSGDAGKNNNLLQPEATTSCIDVAEIATFSKEGEQTGSPIAEKLISTQTVCSDSVSGTQDDLAEMTSSLHCHSATTDDAANGDGVTCLKKIIIAENKVSELELPYVCSANNSCSDESQIRTPHQAAVEFIASLLNGDLKDSESFLAHLEFHEETFSEEEMSPSPGESVLGESFLSLDELAKRIEIKEVSPAAGLVSILKKRDGTEGDKILQPLQKQTKRKVRFQETDDALDQEEIGGGSCILLIVLCIATVFLSIGGTALYCTFGDVDSSVCKDFAANIDFYYTQAAQGVEELRHWLFIT